MMESIQEAVLIECSDEEEEGSQKIKYSNRRSSEPKGRYAVFVAVSMLGLGSLLPWNFFITAETYWQYKLRNTTVPDWTNSTRTELQTLFSPMMVCITMTTNFISLLANAMCSHLISQKVRLLSSLTVMLILFVATTVLVKINTDPWQPTFFVVTMVTIVILTVSSATFQGGVFGVASMLPTTFMCAVTTGQAYSGIFSSVARVVSLAAGADFTFSAFVYFNIAITSMLICLIIYGLTRKVPFFRYYTELQNTQGDEASQSHRRVDAKNFWRHHFDIMKEIWPLGLSLVFVFVVTLSVFPVVCVRVLSSSLTSTWKEIYFQPVITFLLYNVGDLVGRQIAGFWMWPRSGSCLLYLLVLGRVIFVPLFLLCNHSVHSAIPVVFHNDAWYILFMIFFSISNGHLSTLCFMYAPKLVEAERKEKAGMMMSSMCGLGLLLGGSLSFAFALIH